MNYPFHYKFPHLWHLIHVRKMDVVQITKCVNDITEWCSLSIGCDNWKFWSPLERMYEITDFAESAAFEHCILFKEEIDLLTFKLKFGL